MNLASVLHYLQSEWRRWERDRNEWEIERAEMRVSLMRLGRRARRAHPFSCFVNGVQSSSILFPALLLSRC